MCAVMETIIDRVVAARADIAAMLTNDTDDAVVLECLRILDHALAPTQVSEGEDWGVKAQRAAEDHLLACYEAMHAADEGLEVEDPAVGAFCGCETCEVREVLFAAWPIMRAAALDGAE
jgi:hypothetical protein